ncbi:nucleoside triphosphate pyrophosphohydrolase family protein [Candidatus Uhrbacteria bacterium]|nr:nucleoside triphosphate pyrophosphohydrolase family protein [Candidatus Uhrbacteria bacterium]
MTLDEYQQQSRKTALYPQVGSNVTYPTLGLAGETGEVAEQIKKMLRDDGGVMTPQRREAVKKELGDVMWYIAQISSELGFSLEDVAWTNLQKLFSRLERGVLGGSGNDR